MTKIRPSTSSGHQRHEYLARPAPDLTSHQKKEHQRRPSPTSHQTKFSAQTLDPIQVQKRELDETKHPKRPPPDQDNS
ncbi:hypothetical protein VTJ49DRAFT_6280 [Mycothermus thermophilus]|uniref:Uncharacterized protein n=1 Tax=Humicola insolens TaxID=85995 RepID=A0ABR3VJQ5_HUMIN